jgi:hypothetical protein
VVRPVVGSLEEDLVVVHLVVGNLAVSGLAVVGNLNVRNAKKKKRKKVRKRKYLVLAVLVGLEEDNLIVSKESQS